MIAIKRTGNTPCLDVLRERDLARIDEMMKQGMKDETFDVQRISAIRASKRALIPHLIEAGYRKSLELLFPHEEKDLKNLHNLVKGIIAHGALNGLYISPEIYYIEIIRDQVCFEIPANEAFLSVTEIATTFLWDEFVKSKTPLAVWYNDSQYARRFAFDKYREFEKSYMVRKSPHDPTTWVMDAAGRRHASIGEIYPVNVFPALPLGIATQTDDCSEATVLAVQDNTTQTTLNMLD